MFSIAKICFDAILPVTRYIGFSVILISSHIYRIYLFCENAKIVHASISANRENNQRYKKYKISFHNSSVSISSMYGQVLTVVINL